MHGIFPLVLLSLFIAETVASTALNGTSNATGEWKWYRYPNNTARGPTPGVLNISVGSLEVDSPEHCQSLCDAVRRCNLVTYRAGPRRAATSGHKAGQCWLRRWAVPGAEYPYNLLWEKGFDTYHKMWTRFDCVKFMEKCDQGASRNPCCYEVWSEPFCTNWGSMTEPPRCWAGDRRRRLQDSAVMV